MAKRTPPNSLISSAPFAIVLVALAVPVVIALGWTYPDLLWGHWRVREWDRPVIRAAGPPLLAADGVLLQGVQAVALTRQCSRSVPANVRRTWQPGPDAIHHLESDLAPLLRRLDDSLAVTGTMSTTPLTGYRRQYGALELETGERIVYVNGFDPAALGAWVESSRDESLWRGKAVSACDGWHAFWGIEYDPAGRRFRGFAFNGAA